MKRRSVIMISFLTAALLAACGGTGSNAGNAAKQGDVSRQEETGGSAQDENENPEAGAEEEGSGDNAQAQIPDAGAAYQEGEFTLADTDLYSAVVSGYLADEDGLSVRLKIGNKADEEYSYYVYGVVVNHGLVNYEIKDSTGNDVEELKAGPGGNLEAGIRIPASELKKYNLSAVDELRFTISGHPEEEEDYDYAADLMAELEEDSEEPADPETAEAGMTAAAEEADAGMTAAEEAEETEGDYFAKDFCLYPTGKEEKDIIPVRIDTKDEYEWIVQNDQYDFGIRKSLGGQTADPEGAISLYLENRSDQDLNFVLEKITVNGMPMFHAETYTEDPEEEAAQKTVSSLQVWRSMPAGTICLADMLTGRDLAENGIGQIYDLQSVLKVQDDNYKDIESREVSCHFQDAESSAAGMTASTAMTASADPSESASPYVREAVKVSESDLYKLTVTGYDQNDLVFIVHCEMQNKADKAYSYDFYTSKWEINRHFIDNDLEEAFLSDLGNSVEVEAGKNEPCDIVIPGPSLEAFDIDRVDELQFVVSGRSVEDEEAMLAAFDEGNYFFEEKDGRIYDTVTVHPTGMTDEEVNESISVTEKDCAAYVDGDGFSMGILKDVRKNNPYGALSVYFENRTNEELVLTLEEVTINGAPFVYNTDDPAEAPSRQITLRLPPGTKGYMPVLSRHELEENEVNGGVKEFACTLYHKEHPSQGNQFASFAEKITCSFSD